MVRSSKLLERNHLNSHPKDGGHQEHNRERQRTDSQLDAMNPLDSGWIKKYLDLSDCAFAPENGTDNNDSA